MPSSLPLAALTRPFDESAPYSWGCRTCPWDCQTCPWETLLCPSGSLQSANASALRPSLVCTSGGPLRRGQSAEAGFRVTGRGGAAGWRRWTRRCGCGWRSGWRTTCPTTSSCGRGRSGSRSSPPPHRTPRGAKSCDYIRILENNILLKIFASYIISFLYSYFIQCPHEVRFFQTVLSQSPIMPRPNDCT